MNYFLTLPRQSGREFLGKLDTNEVDAIDRILL